MPAPKIFISHSVETDEEKNVLWSIHDALDDAGFEMLLDITRLQEDVGNRWRSTLNTWIEICDGAVLLVGEKARDRSAWILYEAALLAFRQERDRNFVLVPVLVPPVLPGELGRGRFEPHHLSELQVTQASQPNFLEIIIQRLQPLREMQPAETPAGQVEEYLTALLCKVTDPLSIRRAARALRADFSRWRPSIDNERRSLARLLLQADLVDACLALTELVGLLAEERRALRDILVPNWVSFRAVRPLRDAVRRTSEDVQMAVNAREIATLVMYVLRACGKPSDVAWPYIQVLPSLTVDPASEYVDCIINAIHRITGLLPGRVKKLLKNTRSEPLFALFPLPEPHSRELEFVHQELPAVTLFVTTEEKDPTEEKTKRSGSRFLSPALEDGEEDEALAKYDEACLILRQPANSALAGKIT